MNRNSPKTHELVLTTMQRRNNKRKKPLMVAKECIERKRDIEFLKKVWISDEIHWGVVTEKPLCKGDFIAEYRGKLCFEEPKESAYKFEFFNKKTKYWIDASEDDGSMARLINDEHIDPNANIKVLHEGFAEPHLCIFAVNDIKAGEEIRYNYGKNVDFFWRKKK
ncbi:N-lysine methyltransferase KMT5A-like isoform X2 [Crassostrea angulata]|uniref:N-lysine methyltransferase KMT5A-like isoform X2 n=1 Tax=Magallana angulata TaxID=2784310 RepID=UPI0022B09A37|nr:N-lysine methyltransferase KMT5A-like isoform X2 [Crassostrea angulata]